MTQNETIDHAYLMARNFKTIYLTIVMTKPPNVKDPSLRLINNMTIYDKLELIAHLIHSDRIELSLEDRQAGVIYEQKESPQYDPVDAGINGCGIMLYVNVGRV